MAARAGAAALEGLRGWQTLTDFETWSGVGSLAAPLARMEGEGHVKGATVGGQVFGHEKHQP